jgi:cyclohexadieny/prephenate dehydrogenase
VAEPLFHRLTLIGLGLIGSSIARAARAQGDIAAEIVASDSSGAVLERVRALGIADRTEADAARAVEGADGVILCAPVGAFAGLAGAIAPRMARGAILSDVGSTKQSVLRDVGPLVAEGVPSACRHRVFRAGGGVRDAVPRPVGTADAAAGHGRAGRGARRGDVAAAGLHGVCHGAWPS